jgi:hypothetical protein
MLLIWACALALCTFAGWGAMRLALPVSLRPWGALFAPLLGYAIAIYAGYLGVSTVLSLRWSLALLLALAAALNLIAWRRTGPPRIAPAGSRLRSAPLLALLALTMLVGVLPLLRYGYTTVIGQGWDTESYLPLAQHLVDYSLARIPDAPANPLRDLVRSPPAIGVTLGFSVFQGFTMLLSGQTALATFASLLALLRALGILAIYAWLRATMGLGRWAALLGAALASAGALMLWISYFNFGMQMAAWPLLALGLSIGVAAVEELASSKDQRPKTKREANNPWFLVVGPSSRVGVALLAAIALAALPVAYYPALTLWAPLAAGLGAARLVEALRRRPGDPSPLGLLLGALALGALTLLLAAPTILDYFKGFAFRYSLDSQHIGPDRFIAFTETLGLRAFRLANDGPQTPAALVWLAAAAAGALALAGLVFPTRSPLKGEETRRQEDKENLHDQNVTLSPNLLVSLYGGSRLHWLGLSLAALAYLLWLRFGRPYEYGYMKGSAYAGFAAWGLVALGAQALWRRLGRWRAAAAGLTLLPLLVAGWAQALTVADHWRGPAIFRRDIAAFDEAARRLVPREATVAITSDASFTGPDSGLLSVMLYGREIWGHLSTAYAHLDRWPEGGVPQYALLAASERPWPLDLGGRELWRSDEAALFQLGEQAQLLLGRAEIYGTQPAASKFSPAALDIWRRGGLNRAAGPGTPLTLRVGDTLRFGPGQPDGGSGARLLTLALATLEDQRVEIVAGGSAQLFDLKAGVSHVALAVDAPAEVRVASAQPLALLDARATPGAGGTPAGATPDANQVAWTAAAEQAEDVIRLRVRMANPGGHALRIGLTVIEDTFDGARNLAQLLAAAPRGGSWQLNFDPIRGATEALADGAPMPMLSASTTPSPRDGRFFGVLAIYDGEQAVARAPVFTLRVADAKLAEFTPIPFSVEALPAGWRPAPLPGDVRALLGGAAPALDDGRAALGGAAIEHWMPWPGAPADAPLDHNTPLTVRLYWSALARDARPAMISIQVLDAENRKWGQWDGPLGGEWHPMQSWRPGEHVRQDVPLQLDPATPPGAYRLALVVYDPASGAPFPMGGQNLLPLGDLDVR